MNKKITAFVITVIVMLLGLSGCYYPTAGKGSTPSATDTVNPPQTTDASSVNGTQTADPTSAAPSSTPPTSATPTPSPTTNPPPTDAPSPTPAPMPSATRTSTEQSPPSSPTETSPVTTPPVTTPPVTTPPVTTPPSATPSSTAPPAGTSYACVTAILLGRCGPYAGYAAIVGADSQPWVGQNVWSGDTAYRQQLYANSPGDWYVTADANTNFGPVLTYPNTGFDMSGPVDRFSSITSSFGTTFPHNAATAGWAAYDLWFNGWADEVMIQTDISANSFYDCAPVATATFDGSPWHLCVFGSERVWKHGTDDSHPINQATGTIDIKAMLDWMQQHGYLPAGSTWTAGSYGFEICDTGGLSERFQLNGFSWAAR